MKIFVAGATRSAGGHAPCGADGADDQVGRGPRVALRRLLWSEDRDQPGSGRADGGADPQALVPDHRRPWWHLVAHPHR